jgi:ketosteroid isomerase-like protein
MSRGNVETVRRSFEAFNRRDADRLVGLCHSDCEWLPFRAQLEGMVYRGHEGVRRFLGDMDEDWSQFRIDPVELHELGDRVVAIGRVRALGRGSGVDVDSVAGFVVELRDGQIIRVTSHSDPEAALRAARADRAAGSAG